MADFDPEIDYFPYKTEFRRSVQLEDRYHGFSKEVLFHAGGRQEGGAPLRAPSVRRAGAPRLPDSTGDPDSDSTLHDRQLKHLLRRNLA